MQETQKMRIRARGFVLSGAAVMYLFLIYAVAMWGLLLVMIPLAQFFPVLTEYGWLVALPSGLVVGILLLHILCSFHTVILEPDAVTLRWFGIPVRQIPVSRFKTFCAVGNMQEDVLCLSCYSVEEMAQIQEERSLRSALDKHMVPFRKRKADWQDDLAREFLNRLRRSPFGIFRERDVIMLGMHPAIQCAIRQIYPQLPYKNYTGVTSPHAPWFGSVAEDRAVRFPSHLYEYRVRMAPDGIHICNKKEEISFIPAQRIKTVVRVDIFKGYEKGYPHHMPLLFVTGMTEEELAATEWSTGYGGFRLEGASDPALLAMTAATYLTLQWDKDRKDCCVLSHTEKNLQTLRTLYAHIHINDSAAGWLGDR